MADSEVLASRLERIAEWQVGLRPADRADLRLAAAIVRSTDDRTDDHDVANHSISGLDRPTV